MNRNDLLRRLSEEDRQLIGRVVQARSKPSGTSAADLTTVGGKTPDRSALLEFKNLPGYAEQQMLRSAAAAMGLRDPYFLVHENDAGASTLIGNRHMINFSSYDYLGFNQIGRAHVELQSQFHLVCRL